MNVYLVLSSLNLCLGGLVFLLGFVILRENPGQRLNRIVAVMLFFGGLGAILASVAFLSTARPGEVVPGRVQAVSELLQNFSYVWEFFFPSLFLFASIFPEERAFTRQLRLFPARIWSPSFGTLVFAPHVFHFVLMLVITAWKPQLAVPSLGPLHYLSPLISAAGVFIRIFLFVHQALFSLVNLGFGLATMVLLFDSYRKARVPRLKQQLRVITIGLSACLLCYSVASSIPRLFNFELPEGLRSVLTIAALTLGPGSIAYSIVRYKFLDTKLPARRGILYALASAALVSIYLAVVGRLNHFVSQNVGVDPRVIEPVFLIIALALFQPAIARLEEMLDQMFLKDPADYRNVVRQLGRELQTTIDLDVLLSRTIQTLAEALLLRTAHVVVLAKGGAISRTGAGAPLAADTIELLVAVLPRVSARQASYRWTDRVEGLTREEQEELAGRLELSLLVPLRWRGDLVGALLLGPKVTRTEYTSEDVSLLTGLAGQVSVSLQNALLLRDRVAVARFEEELNLARQIQRTSLISDFPIMPNCEVHALYIPSRQVGGDFYDVVSTGDSGFLVAIADVSGKGVPAALLSSMLQASLRTQASDLTSVPSILRNINSVLYRSTALQQFATFFLARIDPVGLRMTFSNAGHNWPVVMKANGERQFLERGGTVLGILENLEFEEAEVVLDPGDIVLFYTDGISEAADKSGELYGEQRLCDFVQRLPRDLSAREVAERSLGALREYLGDVEAQDDITLLVLRVLEPEPAPRSPRDTPEVVEVQ
jgi:sigma-B regulation protein RsbU (phosphoserine phosphatase)